MAYPDKHAFMNKDNISVSIFITVVEVANYHVVVNKIMCLTFKTQLLKSENM